MTDFYRFPEIMVAKSTMPADQVEHLLSEVQEVAEAVKLETYYEPMLELMDVIHSAETMLRIYGCTDTELTLLSNLVIEKNRKRGYYDD